jgi:hypothetical protein
VAVTPLYVMDSDIVLWLMPLGSCFDFQYTLLLNNKQIKMPHLSCDFLNKQAFQNNSRQYNLNIRVNNGHNLINLHTF